MFRVSVCVSPKSNLPLTPNRLSYRNVSDLFGMLRLSLFEWCPLCCGQTPQKCPKMQKTTEKHNLWDFFCLSPFTNRLLTPNRLSYRNVSDLFVMLRPSPFEWLRCHYFWVSPPKNAEKHHFSVCHLLLIGC